ncbi:hypothetical protein D3C73_1270340 [compost metagenome]
MYTSVNPRKIVMVASVAINGAILPLVIISPLTIPMSPPAKQPTTIAKIGSHPDNIRLAVNALDSARIEPTDKSIPPVRITKVIPKAISALIATCLSRFRILRGSIKLGFSTVTITIRMINPSNGPSFCVICPI